MKSTPKIQAVLFDVDGVLLDTVPYHFEAWRTMFAEHGATITFADYLEKLNGLPRDTGIRNVLRHVSEEQLNILATRKQQIFLDSISSHPPQALPGVFDLISHLKKRGVKLSAASSSKNAPALLDRSGISRHFHAVVGGSDFKNPKPAPDIFLKAAEIIGVSPNSCIVVEDATIGVKAAKNAGMKTIGLTRSDDPDIAREADYTIPSLEQYRSILQILGD